MKNFLKVTSAIAMVFVFSITSKAQFNAGIDIALPMGDLADAASIGYGVSIGYEHKIGDNMGVGGEVGYLIFSTKDPSSGIFDNYSSSMSMIPILGNFKYYFTDNESGLYGKAALGMSSYRVKVEYEIETISGFDSNFNPIYSKETFENTASEMYLTYGIGAGYLLTDLLDISLEYRIVDGDGGSANYINIGGAYTF